LRSEEKLRFLQRSRADIIASILENSHGGSRKTRLIYRCNLSLSQFNLYKDFLVESGLLKVSRREDGIEIYETSEKAKIFLRDYKKIKQMLNNIEL